ncbi:uncharacterized protein CLUP02_05471 [Colletotrichum lupini]|uniref:Uncharacterized protein n=1 Tax=Colletotrichum lupini TaxID=145971 RepID=A0A9Q8SN77_9PEZI|nr:uncharacterized protein CLUP02_05471 [Colletotrichum lupini]UQC79990.1 hypothetical protein CLUP02_05471 [Colletotrichum lupini]
MAPWYTHIPSFRFSHLPWSSIEFCIERENSACFAKKRSTHDAIEPQAQAP